MASRTDSTFVEDDADARRFSFELPLDRDGGEQEIYVMCVRLTW